MKIILRDNSNRDNVDDILVCEGLNKFYGEFILKHLKDKLECEDSDRFYCLVEDNYGGLTVEKGAYNSIDMEELKNKLSKFTSSREALTDIGTIDWDIDQMSDKGWNEYKKFMDDAIAGRGNGKSRMLLDEFKKRLEEHIDREERIGDLGITEEDKNHIIELYYRYVLGEISIEEFGDLVMAYSIMKM